MSTSQVPLRASGQVDRCMLARAPATMLKVVAMTIQEKLEALFEKVRDFLDKPWA
jgi:hypothetical protein